MVDSARFRRAASRLSWLLLATVAPAAAPAPFATDDLIFDP
jgi:hypothetical protein